MASKPVYDRQHRTTNNIWTTGQIIEANLLNNMQNQIAQNTQGFSNIVSYSDTQPSGDYSQYNQIWLKKANSSTDSIKLAEVKDLDKVVIISQEQPTDNLNKLWIKDNDNVAQVPSFNEFSQSIENNIAPPYLNSATYSVGQYVTYENKLYMCQTAVTTPNEWNINSNHFIEASIAGPLGYDDPTKGGWPNINASILNKIEEESGSRIQVQNKVNNIENSIAPIYTNKTYNIGDYCTKDGYLYKCNTAIDIAEEWTAAHWTQVTAGGELGDVKSAIDTSSGEVFYPTNQVYTSATSSGWKLKDTGLCASNSGYKLLKYEVTPGQKLQIVSDDLFQFQNSANVPSSGQPNRVGNTFGAGTFVLTAPENATHLIVSTPTTSSASVRYASSVKDKIEKTKQELEDITGYDIVDVGNWIQNEIINSTTGEVGSDSSYERTDYIKIHEKVDALLISTISTTSEKTNYNAFYDENKNYLQTFSFTKNETVSVSIPYGAAYFRISKRKTTALSLSAEYKSLLDVEKDLAAEIDAIMDSDYINGFTSPDGTASGWRLTEDGFSIARQAYELQKYPVKPGMLFVVESDDYFQFQSAKNTPASGTSTRIGQTYKYGRFFVSAPEGSTYLVVSTPVDGSTAAVYTLVPKYRLRDDDTFPLENYGKSWSGAVNGKAVTKIGNEFTFGTYNRGGYRYFSLLSDVLYVSTGNEYGTISEDAYTLQNKLEKNATYELSVVTGDALAGVAYIGIYDIHGNILSDRITPQDTNTEYRTTFVNGGVPIALLAQRSGRTQTGNAKFTVMLRKIYPEWIYGETVNKRIRASRWLHSGDAQPLSLLHFSDIHGDGREVARILAFANAHSDVINDVISTGDMARASWLSDFTFWSDHDISKVLVALGNHEYYGDITVDHSKYSAVAVIKRWIGDYCANWGVTIDSGKSYYYKDYTSSKVRLIVLDCNLTQEEGGDDQKAWLTSVLADAKTNNLTVVIAIHYVYLGASGTYTTIENPFTEAFIENVYSSVYDWSPSVYTAIVQDYIDAGGEFACWIAGHRHKDIISYPTAYPNQMIVSVCQASPDRTYPSTFTTSDMERTTGTATADAFNIVTVDTINKCVKLARVGADLNTFMKPREFTCYNYVTHQIVS